MGIDIYMSWPGMTEPEMKARYTGFSDQAGHLGYLREAYHGGPYVTQFFVEEAFTKAAAVPQDEVDKAEARIEALPEPDRTLAWEELLGVKIPAMVLYGRLEKAGGLLIQRYQAVYNEDPRSESVRGALKAYGDFAVLAKAKEREHGTPVTVYASY